MKFVNRFLVKNISFQCMKNLKKIENNQCNQMYTSSTQTSRKEFLTLKATNKRIKN